MCRFYSVQRFRKLYRIRLLFTLGHDFCNGETLFDRLQKLQNGFRYDVDANRLFRQLNGKTSALSFKYKKP